MSCKQGVRGPTGPRGEPGKDAGNGIRITKARISEDNILTVEMSDGSKVTSPPLVVSPGFKGDIGPEGEFINDVSHSGADVIVMTNKGRTLIVPVNYRDQDSINAAKKITAWCEDGACKLPENVKKVNLGHWTILRNGTWFGIQSNKNSNSAIKVFDEAGKFKLGALDVRTSQDSFKIMNEDNPFLLNDRNKVRLPTAVKLGIGNSNRMFLNYEENALQFFKGGDLSLSVENNGLWIPHGNLKFYTGSEYYLKGGDGRSGWYNSQGWADWTVDNTNCRKP